MDDNLEFGFELVDEASSPAGKIHRELDQLERDLKDLDRSSGTHMGNMGDHFDSAGVGAVALGSTIGGVASSIVSGLASAALGAASFAASTAASFGAAAVGAAAFREKSELALSLLRHGEDGAAQFEHIKDIALEFGTPLNDTVKGFQKLAAMQFSESSAELFFKRMQDLRAVGADADQTGRALLAITQIKATGHLQGDELLQLADAGVSVQLVMNELAKATGKTVAEVDKLKQAGQISADMALDAIDKAIGKKTGSAVAGDAGKRFAESTISGMSDRISNMGGVLSDDVGKQLTPALLELKPILDGVFQNLRSDEFKAFLATAGKAVGEVVHGLLELKPVLDDLFAGLTGDTAQAVLMGVAHAFRSVLETARNAWPIVKEFLSGMGAGLGEGFKALQQVAGGLATAFGGGHEVDMARMGAAAREIGHALGLMLVELAAVAGAIAMVIGVGVELNAWFISLKTDVDAFIISMGMGATNAVTAFIDGLVNGIQAGAARVTAAIASLGLGSLASLTGVLSIHSPSAETEWMGHMLGAGMQKGAKGATPGVSRAMGALGGAALGALPDSAAFPISAATPSTAAFPPMPAGAAPPAPQDPIRIPAPVASSSSVRGDTSLNANITNHITGGKDPQATGKHAGESSKRSVVNELERFAAELGN